MVRSIFSTFLIGRCAEVDGDLDSKHDRGSICTYVFRFLICILGVRGEYLAEGCQPILGRQEATPSGRRT